MELGESRRRLAFLLRLSGGLVAGVGAVALVAASPSTVWADQSNDNSTTTNAAAGAPVVAPVTGAVQVNLACPANVNVLGSQRDSGSCTPGPQANGNSSATTVGGGDQSPGLVGGTLVAPITAAAQLNVSCPVNVNVLSNQRNSGNCAPGSQSNSNSAATRVRSSGDLAGLLGGPLVAPITTGLGLNVTCPTNVNVLSNQQASGDCLDTQAPGSPETPPSSVPPETPPPGGTSTGPASNGPPPAQTYAAEVVTTGVTEAPGPPATGALAVGRGPGGFSSPGALVLAVLAAAAMAVRRLQQER
jgi:hypothetical protein